MNSDPLGPTDAGRGSYRRISVMAARARRRLPVHHPADADAPPGHHFLLVVRLRASTHKSAHIEGRKLLRLPRNSRAVRFSIERG